MNFVKSSQLKKSLMNLKFVSLSMSSLFPLSVCVFIDNGIGDEGAKALAVSLPHLVNLTTIELGSKQSDDGCP